MKPTLLLLSCFVFHLSSASAKCPLLGPNFPIPRNLKSSPHIASASSFLTNALDNSTSTSTSPYGTFNNLTSFSLEVFSVSDPDSIYSYCYSSTALSEDAEGVKKVDGNSIYRIGSITKLFSVYLFLLKAGDVRFDEPITKYVPELLDISRSNKASGVPYNSLDHVDWEDVTIGDLATQTAGVARDYGTFAEFFLQLDPDQDSGVLSTLGLPHLNASEIPSCGIHPSKPLCSRAEFLQGFGSMHPIYAPATGAIYSDAAYQILSYALETITEKSFSAMMKSDVFGPLGLNSTFWTQPSEEVAKSRGVIPINETESWWNKDFGDEAPTGSIYSTSLDVAKFGRAILNSTQLSSSTTRRWMKPRAFSSDPTFSIGAPWEIRRITLPSLLPSSSVDGSQEIIVDVYTKSGGVQFYTSMLALIPQYNIGFSLLAAGAGPEVNTGATMDRILDLVVEKFVGAVEDEARDEARRVYAGVYRSSTVNSSLVVTTQNGAPGMSITEWISEGVDLLAPLGGSMALYPTGLTSVGSVPGPRDVVRKAGFRAVIDNPPTEAREDATDTGKMERSCSTWTTVGVLIYGSVSLDEFVFDVVIGDGDAEEGRARSVSPRALRITLDRAD